MTNKPVMSALRVSKGTTKKVHVTSQPVRGIKLSMGSNVLVKKDFMRVRIVSVQLVKTTAKHAMQMAVPLVMSVSF